MAVYFIADDERRPPCIKIGHAKIVEKRRRELQTGNSSQIKIMGWIEEENDRELEAALHKKFQAKRKRGEWFEIDSQDIWLELRERYFDSYIAVSGTSFEVSSYDRDGIPEFVGPWEWNDIDVSEFCPSCGWGGGLQYNENFGGDRCLKCGASVGA